MQEAGKNWSKTFGESPKTKTVICTASTAWRTICTYWSGCIPQLRSPISSRTSNLQPAHGTENGKFSRFFLVGRMVMGHLPVFGCVFSPGGNLGLFTFIPYGDANLMAIELKSVSKEFGGIKAVSQVSFHVNEGELVALLGPSGGGKTTGLRMIADLETPSDGDIFIGGRRSHPTPPQQRAIRILLRNYAP